MTNLSQIENIIVAKGIGKFELTEVEPNVLTLTVYRYNRFQFGRIRRIRELKKHINVFILPVWMQPLKVISGKGKEIN